jgi:hypothetical protein
VRKEQLAENKKQRTIKKKLISDLITFYEKNTFYEGLLHESCSNAMECWKKIECHKEKSDWNYFSVPYIGEDYKGELMCLGLNVLYGGGRNLQEMQILGYNEKRVHENDIYAYKYQPGVIESIKIPLPSFR